MIGTFWAVVPALITIILALLFKNVYIALFIGVLTGAMMIAGGNPILGVENLFKTMANTLSGSGDGTYNYSHGAILIFILMLGILVVLIEKSGATQASGNWIAKHIKSRKGIMCVTAGFGLVMFMDDYFNRLSTGPVMQPITDRYRISRIKLALIIGSISASICIMIPISSWASTVTSVIKSGLPEEMQNTGTQIFLQSTLCNFYPILMIAFVLLTTIIGMDFFKIREREITAIKTGDVSCGKPATFSSGDNYVINPKGKIMDLLLPILVLILSCIGFMVYFSVTRNGSTNSEISLAGGSTIAVIFTMLLYLPRKVINLTDFTKSIGEGFKSICEVLVILILAWTLSDICKALQVDVFIANIANSLGNLRVLLPAIMFLIAMATAFATGTSWGTFGIIVPLVIPMFPISQIGTPLQLLTVSAVLSGAVFGDQVSPISDATILTAATSKCNHLDYVNCQLPVALMVAGVAFLGFLTGGLTQQLWIGWITVVVAFAALITISYLIQRKKGMLLPKLKTEDLMTQAVQPQTEPAPKAD